MAYINTDTFSSRLRERAVLPSEKQVLITRLRGSKQEHDLSMPVNCNGYGRIRHFRLVRYDDWTSNPLPIAPALKALKLPITNNLRAQVFQNAACNWRCWYCFVDFNRLSADRRVSDYFTADELIELYAAERDPPAVIDLSGGQPDLTPEWVAWTMEALIKRQISDRVFLWSDDNLSNDFYWRFLTLEQRKLITEYPNYARVCCFKGYSAASFSFNTLAAPESFEQQFKIFDGLLREGLDLYAYATFTALPDDSVRSNMTRFVDRLQTIHVNLPLRVVPLKIEVFTPTAHRIHAEHETALRFQYDVHSAWCEELQMRFSQKDILTPICDVPLR